jgi:hypothetical protein
MRKRPGICYPPSGKPKKRFRTDGLINEMNLNEEDWQCED